MNGSRTQELSETESIRGAKAEVAFRGVEVPLIDGVLSPWVTRKSAGVYGFRTLRTIHCEALENKNIPGNYFYYSTG